MKKVLKTNLPDPMANHHEKDTLQGYQFYPESEDIYNKFREEKNMDPEDISRLKEPGRSDNALTNIGVESNNYVFGSNLDVPGSELDDEQANVGNED